MITISDYEDVEIRKRQRAEQILNTKNVLNIIQSKNIEVEELSSLIHNFTKRYSSIATERLLNYHLDICIETFLEQINHKSCCVLKDSINIIESFSKEFKVKIFGKIGEISIEKLIKRINWNTQEFLKSFSQFISSNSINMNFLPSIIFDRFKDILVKELESHFNLIICELLKADNFSGLKYLKLDQKIKNIQDKVSFLITNDEFQILLTEQYTKIISENIFKILINNNHNLKYNSLLDEFKDLILTDDELTMKTLSNSICKEYLHIGNSTEKILFGIMKIIPLVRSLDSSGFVIDLCLKEVNLYLKQNRKDLDLALLNFVVKNLNNDFSIKEIGDKSINLFALDYDKLISKSKDTWKPDPNFIKTFIDPEIRTGNPINLLISLLSSSTSISEIYQKKIAKQLLQIKFEEEVDAIVKEVEMMKFKCGDSFVSSIGIMINDIIESRKFNEINLKNNGIGVNSSVSDPLITSNPSLSLNATVISHRYWPDFSSKVLEHPEFLNEKLNTISSIYSKQFNDKKVVWRPHLDAVEIELEFSNGFFTFKCPSEAAILINSFAFPEDEEFDLNLLTAVSGISDKNLLKGAVKFWLKKRVMTLSADNPFNFRFSQFYDPSEVDCIDSDLTLFDLKEISFTDDEDSSQNDFKIFQKHWPTISNMFKTFGQISAERIQSTLKMYSKEYKEPLESLTNFLQHRVREGLLQTSGNRIIIYTTVNK